MFKGVGERQTKRKRQGESKTKPVRKMEKKEMTKKRPYAEREKWTEMKKE